MGAPPSIFTKAMILTMALACWPRTAWSAPLPRIVFLPQDVTGGYDHRGGTPPLLDKLEEYVSRRAPRNYVKLSLRKLLQEGVAPDHIYDKRYCRPVGNVLGANVFVMARLTVIQRASRPDDEYYDIEAKVYSSDTGREIRLLRAKRIRSADFGTLTRGREDELLRTILSIANPAP